MIRGTLFPPMDPKDGDRDVVSRKEWKIRSWTSFAVFVRLFHLSLIKLTFLRLWYFIHPFLNPSTNPKPPKPSYITLTMKVNVCEKGKKEIKKRNELHAHQRIIMINARNSHLKKSLFFLSLLSIGYNYTFLIITFFCIITTTKHTYLYTFSISSYFSWNSSSHGSCWVSVVWCVYQSWCIKVSLIMKTTVETNTQLLLYHFPFLTSHSIPFFFISSFLLLLSPKTFPE